MYKAVASSTDINGFIIDYRQFLTSRETGLKQGSRDWVNARLSTIGGSEI